MRSVGIFSTDAGLAPNRLGGDANRFRPPRADDHSVTSNRSSEAPVHWRKVGDAGQTRLRFGAKLLKSLALPRGLEPQSPDRKLLLGRRLSPRCIPSPPALSFQLAPLLHRYQARNLFR